MRQSALFVIILSLGWSFSEVTRGESGGTMRLFLLDEQNLETARQSYLNGDDRAVATHDYLVRIADRNLDAGPFSVVFNNALAPSADPHDIVSYGPYTWPNPDTENGLPWIGRDGHQNPDADLDWDEFFGLGRATEPLSLAYYFTGDERYAEKSAELLRAWFIDPETRMNPRDEYSVLVPGRNNGSFNTPGFGNIFGARYFVDALGMLEASPHWSAEDRMGVQQWFRDFISWSQTPNRKVEVQFEEPSNHGTNFDFMFTLMGMYAEDHEFARANFDYYVNERFPGQIAADGSNPLEIKRANNLLYHRYNLNRAFDIAILGDQISDLDFFDYQTEDGRGLRLALDFISPYWTREKEWDLWPGDSFPKEPSVYYGILRRAAVHFGDPTLLDTAEEVYVPTVYRYTDLIYPEDAVYDQVWPGDSNVDGVFDSEDLAHVFARGKYATLQEAGWADGDWNRDDRFDSEDIVLSFQAGGYLKGPRSSSVHSIPEPTSGVLACGFGMIFLLLRRHNGNLLH